MKPLAVEEPFTGKTLSIAQVICLFQMPKTEDDLSLNKVEHDFCIPEEKRGLL
jgi:hypothetical protein